MQKLQQLTAYLQLNQLDQLPALKPLQQKTKLKPSLLTIVLSAFVILVSLLIDITPLVTAIGCTIIPGYFTFQVIGTKVQRQYIKYLVYWVCFGLMEIILEPIVSLVFGSLFVMIFEIGFTFALLHPKFNLALILYDRVIRVYVMKEEAGHRDSMTSSQSNSKRNSTNEVELQAKKFD